MADVQQQPTDRHFREPIAIVHGKAVSTIPDDLYIPPDSLKVALDAFAGPLDLLLYLIKRQNIDIVDIPVAVITEQYMSYIDMMDELKLDLASEYLLMAAMLAEIKSRVLLPRPVTATPEEDDPRATLIRRLQEYEHYKQAADDLDTLPRDERDIFPSRIAFPDRKLKQTQPQVDLATLMQIFAELLTTVDSQKSYHIKREILAVRERMTIILDEIRADNFTDFRTLFTLVEGRSGVIVTFLAVLELLKNALINIVQNEANAPIYLSAA